MIWPTPVIYLNSYYLPPVFNVLFGQVLGWFAGIMAGLSQLLLTSNRAFAVYFPGHFSKHYKHNPTNIAICVVVAIATLIGVGGNKDGCHFLFRLELLSWAPEDFPCARTLSNIFVYVVLFVSFISNMLNIATLMKLITDSARLSLSRVEHNRRSSRRRVMFIQNVFQEFLMLIDNLNRTLVFRLFDAYWFQFCCSCISMVLTRFLEGLVMVFVNDRMRVPAKRLLRIQRAKSANITTMQKLSTLFRFGSRLTETAARFQKPSMMNFAQAARYSSGYIFDVDTAEDFSEKVINSDVPVIADFHAEWCGPCQALGPRLEEKINGRNGQVLLAKINVDNAGEIAMDYGITAVPTIFAFKNGEKIGGFSGVLDDEQLDEFLDQVTA
ncbi:unnamed protein product [Caenorhabditis bovis]|uniref:Thioredoxin domain-containing protein n=1 Tax=Caenorhabditis bovis TaxID=2654633 RepID=A0A8S1EG97_9PELO|nr:unnamed protein product [Caenorhabditis bovis]